MGSFHELGSRRTGQEPCTGIEKSLQLSLRIISSGDKAALVLPALPQPPGAVSLTLTWFTVASCTGPSTLILPLGCTRSPHPLTLSCCAGSTLITSFGWLSSPDPLNLCILPREHLEELKSLVRELGLQEAVRFVPSFTDRWGWGFWQSGALVAPYVQVGTGCVC